MDTGWFLFLHTILGVAMYVVFRAAYTLDARWTNGMKVFSIFLATIPILNALWLVASAARYVLFQADQKDSWFNKESQW